MAKNTALSAFKSGLRARKAGHRKKAGFTLPLAVVGGFMPLILNVWSVSGGGIQRMGWMATQAMTGYDTDTKKFWLPNMNKGLFPIIGGFLVHYLVGNKLGLNRALGRMRIPIIRI